MAIQKTIALQDSFGDSREFSDAYIKVDFIKGNKHRIIADVGYYRNHSDLRQLKTDQFAFDIVVDGDNFIKQAYQFLKTLPEFADAVDC
jgi:hypothetical protein